MTITVNARAYGLYEQYAMAIDLAVKAYNAKNAYNQYISSQKEAEADFQIAMGDMLRDGTWTNDNYIAGQEQFLYNDALDVMKEISKPTVKYSVSLVNFATMMGQSLEDVQLNTKIRLYDP